MQPLYHASPSGCFRDTSDAGQVPAALLLLNAYRSTLDMPQPESMQKIEAQQQPLPRGTLDLLRIPGLRQVQNVIPET